jgi:hypothetical protein
MEDDLENKNVYNTYSNVPHRHYVILPENFCWCRWGAERRVNFLANQRILSTFCFLFFLNLIIGGGGGAIFDTVSDKLFHQIREL